MNDDVMDPIADLERANEHPVQIHVERRRYGKEVTVITGFGRDQDLAQIARQLKRRLATGGSAKRDGIELQGDHVTRLGPSLAELGLQVKEAARLSGRNLPPGGPEAPKRT